MAKVWAVKSHLAEQYKYNQEELDELVILETKRTNKDISLLKRRETLETSITVKQSAE